MSITPLPSVSTDWHALRLKYIGGSESAALMGMQADYAPSPYALWHIKKGLIPVPNIANERTGWGLRLEQVIAEAACEQEGWRLGPGVYAVDDEQRGMAASIDRVIQPSSTDIENGFNGPGVLEIKNVDGVQFRRKWLDGEPPPHILIQHQHQLACTGYEWGAVAALVGGNQLTITRYRARPKIMVAIRSQIEKFWQSIEKNEPPSPDGHASTSDTIRAIYAEPKDDELDLSEDEDAVSWCEELTTLCDQIKSLQKREAALKNLIRVRIGNHQKAIILAERQFRISRSIGQDVPSRPAKPGEIIKGRRGQDRLTISEIVAEKAREAEAA